MQCNITSNKGKINLQLLACKFTVITIAANVFVNFIFIKPSAMKNVYLAACLLLIGISSNAQHKSTGAKKPEAQIRQYYFVMLLKGPNRSQDSATAATIQAGHMANINRLYKLGKLKVAGPFGDDGDWLGIFIFDCATKEEVEGLLKTDPAVAAGRLNYDIRPWYTAASGSFKPGKP
jgi:uncharacterized protein YciI